MALNDAYGTNECSQILGIAVKNVLKRAVRENWQSRPRHGRGGGREWLVSSMPEATRLALAARSVPTAPAAMTPTPSNPDSPLVLHGKARGRAQVRAAVVLAARSFTVNSRLSYTRAMEEFVVRYNSGEIFMEADVRAALPTLCRNSLINWDKKAQASGMASLAGNYGAHRKGTGIIDSQPAVVDIILGMFKAHPHTSAQLILEAIQAHKFKGEDIAVPSLRRLQLWLADWKRSEAQLAQKVKAPDRWKSRFRASCGDAYELVTRYNQRWEYDGTPADLLLNDGKRYTIVGIINVYSREVLLEVAERSTGQTVGNLTRTAIIEWGVPEEVVTDNGKEFVGNFMQGLFLDLGILMTVLPPFRPELKPAIERVFNSFSHHLLTLCPCYVGHNVATRQEIRERETFAKRLMNRKGEEELSMAVSPEELQAFCDDWCKNVYGHRAHRGLHGKTPYEMRREYAGVIRRLEDVRALDILLTTDGGWRTVGKKGVRARGGVFAHAALGPIIGQRVKVRYNPWDVEHAVIYDENGRFVCEAVRVAGLDGAEVAQLAVEMRRAQNASLRVKAERLDKAMEATNARNAATDIMEMHKARAAEIEGRTPPAQHAEAAYTTPAVEEAARAVALMDGKSPLQHDAEVAAKREAARKRIKANGWLPESPRDKFRLAEELDAAEARGEAIPADRKAWKECFKASNTYAGFKLLAQMGKPAVAAG